MECQCEKHWTSVLTKKCKEVETPARVPGISHSELVPLWNLFHWTWSRRSKVAWTWEAQLKGNKCGHSTLWVLCWAKCPALSCTNDSTLALLTHLENCKETGGPAYTWNYQLLKNRKVDWKERNLTRRGNKKWMNTSKRRCNTPEKQILKCFRFNAICALFLWFNVLQTYFFFGVFWDRVLL